MCPERRPPTPACSFPVSRLLAGVQACAPPHGACCDTPGGPGHASSGKGTAPASPAPSCFFPVPPRGSGSCRHAGGRLFTPLLRFSLSRACGEPAQLPAKGPAGRSAWPLWDTCPTLHNPYNGKGTLIPNPQAPRVTPSSGPPSPGSRARPLEPEPGLRGVALSVRSHTSLSVRDRAASLPRVL